MPSISRPPSYPAARHSYPAARRAQPPARRENRDEAEPNPTAAIIGSQSVRPTKAGDPRGYDAAKTVMGRERHIAVDTRGLLPCGWIAGTSVITELVTLRRLPYWAAVTAQLRQHGMSPGPP